MKKTAHRSHAPLPRDLERVVVFMTDNHLGDFVLALPTLQELGLHFTKGIDLIVAAQHVELANLLNINARIIPYYHQTRTKKTPKQLLQFIQMLARLVTARYQAAIFCKGRVTESSFAIATHAPVRVAFSNVRRRFAYNRLIDNSTPDHEAEKIGCILQCIGKELKQPFVRLEAPAGERNRIQELLHSRHIGNGEPLVVMHPFAGVATRCWPRERFIEAADELVKRHNAHICLIGAPNERSALEEMTAAMKRPGRAFVLAGSLTDLLALFHRADLLFSNESGPTHLAALTDIPIVTLFGPTIEKQWKPARQKRLTILRGLERCKPCKHAGCPLEWACIRNVTVNDALAAMGTYLATTQ